jgi:hypothetical protein
VVGVLGGWDPTNELVRDKLGLGHSCCRLMRKLMCTKAMKWSCHIQVEHITGREKT